MASDDRTTHLSRQDGFWRGRFRAMACPCEVLLETDDERAARAVLEPIAACAWEIDDKYSRYRGDNVVHRINSHPDVPLNVDAETANLLDFASAAYHLSGGLFDVTSGVLRRVWRFDGENQAPDAEAIHALLPLIGWGKVSWRRPVLRMQPGMQIDLGGICKEYAVDRASELARRLSDRSCLVNFGGDLAVTRPRVAGCWRVGIETVQGIRGAANTIELTAGALATSGDTHRFVMVDGKRYGHILDPLTGWPVQAPPRSVTVAADTCTQAGTLATIAILKGAQAERFLRAEKVPFWVQW